MSWQKCPKCNGSGKDHTVPNKADMGFFGEGSMTFTIGNKCHVCNGYGIVSVFTGAPPCYKKQNNNFEGPTKL